MPVNNIALMPLQRESSVDGYLSAFAQGQQLRMQREQAERAQAQEGRQQTEFDMNRKMQAIDQLGAIVDQIPDGDAQKFGEAVNWAVKNGLLDPNEAAKYNVNQLPQIRAMSQQARALIAQRQKQQMDEREFGLKEGLTRAQIGAQRANAAESYARAGALRAAGGVGGSGAGGMVPGANKPLSETQSKDVGWFYRAQKANAGFTPDTVSELINSRNVVGRNVPVVGNALQTAKSRQGVQTAKNFVAVVLRKDTGAAVTPKEFDFYEDIFIPQWGDDDGTLAQKAQARVDFMNGLRLGLNSRVVLARMGINPPADLAPQEDGVFGDRDVVPSQPGGWSAVLEE